MNRRFRSGFPLFGVLFFFVVSGEALGFSYICVDDRDPAPFALARYDAVFVGTAVATRLLDGQSSPGMGRGEISTEFLVNEIFKGEAATSMVVIDRTPLNQFRLGGTYLVWANREAGSLVTDDCKRNSSSNTVQFEQDVGLLRNPERTPRTACEQLEGEGRRAMIRYVNVAFPRRARRVPPDPVVGWADEALASQRGVAAACLRRIVERGLGGTGLWDRRTPPPNNGDFALELLSRVDPPSAVPFWRARREKARRYPWDAVELDLRLLGVNDRFAIPAVIWFLRNPPELATREAMFASVASRAFRELARLRYKQAAPLLQQFRERGVVPEPLADVYAAWLREDRTRLAELSADPLSADAANDALSQLDAETPP